MAENVEKRLVLDREEYIQRQIYEAITGFNRWVTGIALQKDPTNDETMTHYCEYGGPDDFAERFAIRDVVEQQNQNQLDQT